MQFTVVSKTTKPFSLSCSFSNHKVNSDCTPLFTGIKILTFPGQNLVVLPGLPQFPNRPFCMRKLLLFLVIVNSWYVRTTNSEMLSNLVKH